MSETPQTDALVDIPTPSKEDFGADRIKLYKQHARNLEMELTIINERLVAFEAILVLVKEFHDRIHEITPLSPHCFYTWNGVSDCELQKALYSLSPFSALVAHDKETRRKALIDGGRRLNDLSAGWVAEHEKHRDACSLCLEAKHRTVQANYDAKELFSMAEKEE